MTIKRRMFVVLSVSALAACDRRAAGPPAAPATAPAPQDPLSPAERAGIDAGALSDFPRDGVYDTFREQGFFLVRREGRLFALSSICTHRGCKVRAQADQSFLCKCHGSTFDPQGAVTKAPADRDLPRLAVALVEGDRVLVNLDLPVSHLGDAAAHVAPTHFR